MPDLVAPVSKESFEAADVLHRINLTWWANDNIQDNSAALYLPQE